MANDEAKIKQKIELDGEKEYSAAIKNANRSLKTLRSELKAETAELGKNATEQQKNEVKAKSLQKQIAEQEKVVKACRDALEEVRQKYGDNEDAMAQYEQKLNAARATLANMRGALDDCGESFADTGSEASQSNVEVKAFADSIQSLSGAANTVADAIGGLFTGMVSTVASSVSEVWDNVTEIAARANEWSDLAGYWNTSATNIQKWYRSVEGTANNFEDLSNAVTRIVMGDQKKIAEATGVSSEAYQDEWEYAMAVMDSLSRMSYEQRMNALGDVFGEKRATKVADLVNDWAEIVELTEKFDAENGGIGMSEDDLETMNSLSEQAAKLEQSWAAFKDSFVAGAFGQLGLDLTGNAQAILDALIAFMDADTEQEREDALDSLKESITAFFTRVGEAIGAAAEALKEVGTQMQESENGWVSTIGDILVGLSEALEWFTVDENIEKVKAGFLALAAVWTGAKITSAIGNLASLAANIALVKNAGGLLGIFGGAKAATTAATAASGAGGGALATLGAFAAKVVAPLAAFAGTLGWNAFTEQGNDEIIDKNGNLTETAKETGFYVDKDGNIHEPEELSIIGWDKSQNTMAQAEEGATGITPEQRAAAEAFWDAYRQDPMNGDIWGESYDEFEQAFAGMEDVFDELDRRLNDLQMEYEDDSWQGLEDIPASIFNGYDLSSAGESIDNAASTMQGLPGQIQAAVRGGMSGIRVQMDGETVGTLVAPYVSLEIAKGIG